MPTPESRPNESPVNAAETEKVPAARRKSAASSRESKKTPGNADPGSASAAEHEPATARAEQLVDQVGYKIGRWATRLVARTREGAEDIWAEAQNVRNSGRT